MSNILTKAIVLVLNRNWQAINVRTPQEAFCMMATNVATGLEIEGEDHIRPVTWEEAPNLGTVHVDSSSRITGFEEKPAKPKSNYAVTGLYFYDNTVAARARALKPSPRGELEITDLNRLYLNEGLLEVKLLGRGMAWLDTGTYESLLQAANFIATLEQRQGLKASCIEEIAYKRGFIDKNQLINLAEPVKNSQYGKYLLRIANDEINVYEGIK